MVVLVVSALAVLAVVAGERHRRRRQRWVSPYATFRAAGARVTRTGGVPFRVAGVEPLRPESS